MALETKRTPQSVIEEADDWLDDNGWPRIDEPEEWARLDDEDKKSEDYQLAIFIGTLAAHLQILVNKNDELIAELDKLVEKYQA